MDNNKTIAELLRPVSFHSKRIKMDIPMIKEDEIEFDKWKVRLTYKNKQLENIYMAKKGQFKQPRLDMILNSYFMNSYMYRNYDYFDIAEMIGKGLNGGKGVSEFMEHLKEGHENLKELFGEDFEVYDEAFLMVRPAHLMLDIDRKLKQLSKDNRL